MILRNPIQRSLKKVRQWSHEAVLAIATAHQDDDLRKDRFVIHSRVHKEESNEKLLV